MHASTKKKLVWSFVLFLGIVHWDFWFWNDRTLVFGFLPIGLLYQALISVGAATAWALVVRYAWPAEIEEWASEPPDAEPRASEPR